MDKPTKGKTLCQVFAEEEQQMKNKHAVARESYTDAQIERSQRLIAGVLGIDHDDAEGGAQ
jgi:hypothetical protein